MGWIIHVEGHEIRVPTLFQVADCDTGLVRWISADEATRAEAGSQQRCGPPSERHKRVS